MLDISALLVFMGALLLNAGVPGPSVAAMVSRVLANGWRDVVPFVAAMWIGETIWMTLAVAGLAALADSFALAFTIIKYCGVGYLVFLAWQMWRAPVPDNENISAEKQVSGGVKMFVAGFSITMGNPKIVVFYMALLPALVDLQNLTVAGWFTMAVIMIAILALIDIAYIALASRARRYLRGPVAVCWTNRVGATAMVGAAALIASK